MGIGNIKYFTALFCLMSLSIFCSRSIPDDIIGKWMSKNDSTSILLKLEKDKTGKIQLFAKQETYLVNIINYNVIKTDTSLIINLEYGERNSYPIFFYDIKTFEVERMTNDSLYMWGFNSKSSWRLRLKKL